MKALATGRLGDAAGRTDAGWWKIDPEKGVIAWEDHTNPTAQRDTKAGGAPRRPGLTPSLFDDPAQRQQLEQRKLSLAGASARRVDYQSRLLELELEEKAGGLINRAGAQRAAFAAGRVARDKLLGIADRVSADLAVEESQRAIHQKLVAEISKVLDELTDVDTLLGTA